MSDSPDIEFVRRWYDRKLVADRNREPLYVTPEEYQELLDWAAREAEERERRWGPQMFKVPAPDEPRSLQDMYFGTPVVVDRVERDRQVGREVPK